MIFSMAAALELRDFLLTVDADREEGSVVVLAVLWSAHDAFVPLAGSSMR